MNIQPSLKNTHIVFMGSPRFAVPILAALEEQAQVVAVVTQPDKPAGRGKELVSCEVKNYALEHDLRIFEPRRLRKESAVIEALRNLSADIFVVAAYGQILPPSVLEIPQYGCINVHASLLPRWRGASPIQAAILHGDQQTGVTIMKMDEGMDTGPVLKSKAIPILSMETSETLSQKLSDLGRDVLLEVLPGYLQGEILPVPQVGEDATYAPLIKKEDGMIDPNDSAEMIERKIRAFNPWPGTYIEWDDLRLKVNQVEILAGEQQMVGARGVHEKYPTVGTGKGVLKLLEVQVPGRKPVRGKEFLNGARNWLER